MIVSKEQHVHKFESEQSIKVMLHKYRNESGKPEDIALTGYDILKQRKCACGKVETYDLVRNVT